MSSNETNNKHLIDSDVFISYVKADNLIAHSEKVVHQILEGKTQAYVSSMLYEDITRAASVTAITNLMFHPTTAEVDLLAFTLMKQYRIASLFDAYHVATAKIHSLPLITSDKYIIQNQEEIGLTVIDLRSM